MSHLVITPILLPALTAILLVFLARSSLKITRGISLISALALLYFSFSLVQQSAGGVIEVYSLSNWEIPFGIILVADRLSSLMVLLNAMLVVAAVIYCFRGNDERADNLQALIQFLVMGVNGAFLTGDLFNLFVFFEVMLIASYALLLHGGGKDRAKAGLHYVLLNLVGSSLFILGVGIVYGLVGTLNMAHLAERMTSLPPENTAILSAAALILLMVFGLKSAMLPLYFWLPKAYSSVSAPVAVLFAIMTKVGIYSIVRVHGMIFLPSAVGETVLQWLWPIAIATMAAGAIGVLGARKFRIQIAYTIIVSVGTMLGAIAIHNEASMQALFYYMLHSTWITALLFLLADVIATQRGSMQDSIVRGPQMKRYRSVGIVFVIALIALIGMPPLSGFFGKVLLLSSVDGGAAQVWYWSAILLASLATLIATVRTGSTFFWRVNEPKNSAPAIPKSAWLSLVMLIGLMLSLVVLAEPILQYMKGLGEQLMDTQLYYNAVFGFEVVPS
ncbi:MULTISPECIES: monovalent cation/H+ antiporter subunit D [Gammaproteobacteria]|uniref:monovalent cation/H+ antiporter subunit D n=1 Tax=Gammaproteobacteria TaxID=1236 RepID=UPI000DCFDB0D|nr:MULTISPECIES: monovalent cation/H+ antiporter subunit D [Gammaproteobacteria]RTE86648.1 monovalent cation/H+ antiporter subunit D [Aliidiomarina sp. B3213]TCZ90797.1 monovalent cation/H+ antiporter subunit D [Lysobacter sp. N42]